MNSNEKLVIFPVTYYALPRELRRTGPEGYEVFVNGSWRPIAFDYRPNTTKPIVVTLETARS